MNAMSAGFIRFGLAAAVSLGFVDASPSGQTSGGTSPAGTTDCKWCYDWAFSPMGPYSGHQFQGGGEADNDLSVASLDSDATQIEWSNGAEAHGPWVAGFDATLSRFTPGSVNSEFRGSHYMDCVAFNACHTNVQDGGCQNWHMACQFGEDALDAFDNLSSVADSRGTLSSLLLRRSSPVRLTSDHSLLQVLDCSGQIVAQVPAGRILE